MTICPKCGHEFESTGQPRNPGGDPDNARKLFVGGLPWAVDDDALRELLEGRGFVVDSATVHYEYDNPQRSRGFGFVHLRNPADVPKAISKLDGLLYEGRRLRVNVPRRRDE
jgi:RNA recognition motif-containing protein